MTEYRTGYLIKSTLKYCLMLEMFGASLMPGRVSAAVITSEEEQTGLRTWEWTQAGISVQLVQRLPDQTRAFFQGRGFSSEEADSIAKACVFQMIFRNDGKHPIAYDMDDWMVGYRGERRPLLTRERWDDKWRDGETSQAARIAFRWSLLPTRQSFEPGDYNWCMTSFGLPPGESFDLSLIMTINGHVITSRIPAVTCAAEQMRN